MLMVCGRQSVQQKLGDFGKFCLAKNAPALAVMTWHLERDQEIQFITTDADGRITSSRKAKTRSARSRHRAVYYPKSTIALISYHRRGNNPDNPALVQWLTRDVRLYWRVPAVFDIGSKNAEEANRSSRSFNPIS